jgi:hypothetical protein
MVYDRRTLILVSVSLQYAFSGHRSPLLSLQLAKGSRSPCDTPYPYY